MIKYKVERWPLRTHEFSYKNFLLLQSVYPEWNLTYEQYYDFCKYDGHDPCSADDHSDCREMKQDIYCRDNHLEKEYQPLQYVDRWVGKSEFLNSLLLDRVIRKKLGVELPRKNKKR